MSTNEDFDPTHTSPRRPADLAVQGIETGSSEAVAVSPVLKAGILVTAIAASGIAVVAIGNPATLLAGVSASLVGNPPPPSAPVIQSAVEAPAPPAAIVEAVAPTTKEASASNEAAVSEPVGMDQSERSEPSPETLFALFQAWAVEQDAQQNRVPVQPVQPVQVPPAQVERNNPAPAAENVRPPRRPVQKRQVRSVQNARAEMRRQKLRKQVRRPQAAQPPQRSRVEDARAQDTSAQSAQAPAPSFLPFFNRN
ncbi:MAG: hypothetical protein AB7I42_03070 [Bradyrhizobium sp.]|uniref:hypothetical protein n=1 Tax=Bradyrhizobium sp. TaxID=376 RepID=UPI003D0D0385